MGVKSVSVTRRALLFLAGMTLVFTSLVTPTIGQDAITGRIVGVVRFLGTVQGSGSALAGARVTVTAANVTQSVIADADGRFEFSSLPTGSYVVIGELAGFQTETQRDVVVTAGVTRTVGLDLQLACLDNVDYADQGTPWAARDADALLHVRISEVRPPARWALDSSCVIGVEHTATVVRALETRRGQASRGSTIRFVHEGASYAAGDEYVVLLRWDPAINRFWPVAAQLFMFPVKNGKVVWTRNDAATLRDGMSVDDFLAALNALRADAAAK